MVLLTAVLNSAFVLRFPRLRQFPNRYRQIQMTATEDIRDIFSILHDGGVTAWKGNNSLLTLTVECDYLAELIDKSFDRFYVELYNIDELFLTTWPNPFDLPVQTLTELSDIFESELELLSANIKEGKVVIDCCQQDIKFDYCGGNLTISCEKIKVYDQNINELTVEQLDIICNTYWDNARKEIEKGIIERNRK